MGAPLLGDGALAAAFDRLPSSGRFTPDQLEVVYRLAFSALAGGRFETALRYFQWLAVYRGSDVRHWRGLAACHQALGQPAQALWPWTLVSLLEPAAVDATLHAGRCQAELGQVAEALHTLGLVCRHAAATHPARVQAERLIVRLRQAGRAQP